MDFVNRPGAGTPAFRKAAWKGRGSVVVILMILSGLNSMAVRILETGEAFETEQRLRNADGEYRWHYPSPGAAAQ